MSDLTISIPSEFLALDYWKQFLPGKTQGFLYFLYISIAYGVLNHLVNLRSIRKWNSMSKDERFLLGEQYKSPTTYKQIPAYKILLVFAYFSVFGLAFKSSWGIVRLVYNFLLWPIFCALTAQKLPFMKSINITVGRPKGAPPLRFVCDYRL